MSKDQIKQLQMQLNRDYGFNLAVDGIKGPATENAIAKAAVMDRQKELNTMYGANLVVDGFYGPKTDAAVKQAEMAIAKNDPNVQAKLAPLTKTKTFEEAWAQIANGDLTGMTDANGVPFSEADQAAALRDAEKATEEFYKAQQDYETKNVESTLKQKQADYQNYLLNAKANFEQDKATLDQQAAEKGVLFSGGRAQKLKNLGETYSAEQAYKQGQAGSAISDTARDYQYKYGNTAAGGLSSYYNLGGNTYNPNVATGGVGTGGLSSVYNTGAQNYYGTANTAKKAENLKRSAGLLWNKGNKLMSTGSGNQYNS